MKVLLVGSGGREHALAWALAASENCEALYCAPGNAGIESCAECVDIKGEDVQAVVQFAKDKDIDLVVVGPEAPLVAGLADALIEAGIDVFGPKADAARLEGSKGFMKDLCAKYAIPTAAYGRFSDFEQAKAFIEKQPGNVVVKADGLAAGKGVIICQNKQEAIDAAEEMLSGEAFGDAGSEIVIEEFMDGEELSYFALADGKTILPLTSAQDHKRVFDGDEGPNTGGMGAYSPAHLITAELEEKIIHKIIRPTIEAMAAEGCPFTGVLYAGLMIVNGEPKLIEYNVRFGDPECQPMMMRLQGDLLEILQAGAQGRLNEILGTVTWSDKTALCVVMAAKGYPGSYPKGTPISNIEDANEVKDLTVFHAGTALKDGQLVSTGGRVLGVTALGDTIADAQRRAYMGVDKIEWPDGFCRRDIGWRALAAEKAA
ncbi:MAG: phosphoribosylamine--glycine ligase [Alphaproteobacteria bacterium]|nr:phosphoribosylamine--glycine ligase [Alphaproteobacteria bacterium]